MPWLGYPSKEDWADYHCYMRVHCKIHGNSWSDVGRCEACDDDQTGRDEPDEEE